MTFIPTTITVAIIHFLCFALLQQVLIQNSELPFIDMINLYYSLPWFPHVQATLNVVQGVADAGLVVSVIIALWKFD